MFTVWGFSCLKWENINEIYEFSDGKKILFGCLFCCKFLQKVELCLSSLLIDRAMLFWEYIYWSFKLPPTPFPLNNKWRCGGTMFTTKLFKILLVKAQLANMVPDKFILFSKRIHNFCNLKRGAERGRPVAGTRFHQKSFVPLKIYKLYWIGTAIKIQQPIDFYQ